MLNAEVTTAARDAIFTLGIASTVVLVSACLALYWLPPGGPRRMLLRIAIGTIVVVAGLEICGFGRIVSVLVSPSITSAAPPADRDVGGQPAHATDVRTLGQRPSTATGIGRIGALGPASVSGTLPTFPEFADAPGSDSSALNPFAEPIGSFRHDNSVPIDRSVDVSHAPVERSELPSFEVARAHPQLVSDEPAPDPAWQLWPRVALFWLVIGLLVAGRMAAARIRLWWFLYRYTWPADGAMVRHVARLSDVLKTGKSIRVRHSDRLVSPAVCGVVWPTMIVPSRFDRELSGNERDAVLAHELAHLSGGDVAWQGVADLTAAALWWQPMMWWVRHRLRIESEVVADEASAWLPAGRRALATALLRIARSLARQPRGAVGLSALGRPSRSQLADRVEQLIRRCTHQPRRIARWQGRVAAAVCIPVLALTSFLGTAWSRTPHPESAGENSMRSIPTSWQMSLVAAAVSTYLITPAAAQDADDDDGRVEVEVEVHVDDDSPDVFGVSEDTFGTELVVEEEEEADQRRPRRIRREVRVLRDGPRVVEETEDVDEFRNLPGSEFRSSRNRRPAPPHSVRDRARAVTESIVRQSPWSDRPDRGDVRNRRHRVAEHPNSWRTDRRPGGELEEARRRIHHLEIAAANLEEAGLHDEANRLRHEVESITRAIAERERERERHARDGQEGGERSPDSEADRLREEVAHLSEQVHVMHAHMREMHMQMEQMMRHIGELHELRSHRHEERDDPEHANQWREEDALHARAEREARERERTEDLERDLDPSEDLTEAEPE